MLWKHQKHLEEESAGGHMFLPANPIRNDAHGAREQTDRIFGPHSPVSSINHQESSIMNPSQQGPLADVHSGELENVDTIHSPSVPNLHSIRGGKSALRPATGQTLRPKHFRVAKRVSRGQGGQVADRSRAYTTLLGRLMTTLQLASFIVLPHNGG